MIKWFLLLSVIKLWTFTNINSELTTAQQVSPKLMTNLFKGSLLRKDGYVPLNPIPVTINSKNGENPYNLHAPKRIAARAVCDCGIQQYVPHRILGGIDAFPNEYPWMVALVFPPGMVSCGGSLISERFALSAAHCFINPVSSLYVLLGITDLRAISPSTQAVPVRQVVVHPQFNRTSGDSDLALIEFAFPITYTSDVSPVCMPFPDVDLSWQQVVTMGWGLTQFAPASYTLQEVTLTVVPTDVCQEQYGVGTPITGQMLCAWGTGKDACKGDSGGPLIWNIEGRWYLVGIVSFGMECGMSNSAGVYTRVDRFLDWIISETENTACLSPATILSTMPYPWLITRRSTSLPTGTSTSNTDANHSTATISIIQ